MLVFAAIALAFLMVALLVDFLLAATPTHVRHCGCEDCRMQKPAPVVLRDRPAPAVPSRPGPGRTRSVSLSGPVA